MKKKNKSGFSLVEVLVAMAILSIIVMTLSTVFNQSGAAWDRGLSKSQSGMEGRSALNMMVTELKNAVPAPVPGQGFQGKTIFTGNSMSFNTIGKAEKNSRAMYYVSYASSGSELKRKVSRYNPNDYNLAFTNSPQAVTFISKIDNFTLTYGTGTNELPDIVTIAIKMQSKSSVGRVVAYSCGPNRSDDGGTGDDISSKGH